jgi:hypothetical protein
MAKFNFFTTTEFNKEFKRLAKKYKSLSSDLLEFKEEFDNNPIVGIDLGANLRKIRVSIKSKNKGKSGGARIIVYDLVATVEENAVILVLIFDKNETNNVSNDELKSILRKEGFIK